MTHEVVGTFADARQNDLQNLAEEMEDEIEHDRKALAKLFAKIDKDNSGQLTLQELIEGARQDPGFQSRLRVMDIDENDLHQLFQMIDIDRSGHGPHQILNSQAPSKLQSSLGL